MFLIRPTTGTYKNGKKLKINKHLGINLLIISTLFFGAIGMMASSRVLAATVATLQAELMTLPSGTTVINDAAASGGKAVQMTQNGSKLNGSVTLGSKATALQITARSAACKNAWATMAVSVDNVSVLPATTVSAAGWTTYTTPALSLASGTHTVSLTYGNGKCSNLYVDALNFTGPNLPTVTISASPSSITNGGASIISWSSTNATSCSASGAWTGSKTTSGSISTGALTTSSTYSLTCVNSGGSTVASTTVTVAAATPGVDVSTYGAVGDGITDDTAALNQAFAAAPSGSTLLLPAGKTYAHNASLYVSATGIHITGGGTLLATNQLDSAMQVRAANVVIDGSLVFKFNTAGVTRQVAGWQTMIFVDHVAGATIRNITVDGSPSAGILMYGASNYLVDAVVVQNTLADCIHSTNVSHDGVINSPILTHCGDDGVAVVSYLRDGAMSYNIQVNSPKNYSQDWGRSFTVVGGHDITFRDVYSDSSAGAAVYVSAEQEWDTYGVYNVKVLGGTLLNSNTNATIDHGAIFVYNSQASQQIGTVDIENITVQNTRATASRQIGYLNIGGGGISGVQLRNVTVTGGPANLFVNNIASSGYNNMNWKFNGTQLADHVGFTPYP